MTYLGPAVGNVLLDKITINPGVAMSNQSVTYSVRYTSLTNTAPVVSELDLDGIKYFLQPPSGTLNYATGVTYTYTTSSLALGEHYYRFKFDDGTGPVVVEGKNQPVITPITITSTTLSPTSGNASTTFTFSATYTSATGSAPTLASLYVDNVGYPMAQISGTYQAGAVYQVKLSLPVGSHTYFFVFIDSLGNRWANPAYPQFLVGPTVSASARLVNRGLEDVRPSRPVVAGPSHDENPDQTRSAVFDDDD
jgi:hypothetical protein